MYRKFGSNWFEPSSQNLKNHRTENRTDSPKSVDRTELNLNQRFGSFGSQYLHQFGTELRHHYPEDPQGRCCCCRILHNQPDFANVKSILEEHCEKCGFLVLILPKFHCEINPLEMVWGQAKIHYWLYPPSKKEEDLEANVVKALDSVTLNEMRR